MSRFYLDESYIPRIQKMLDSGASATEIGMRLGYTGETIKKFIKRHKIKRKLIISVAI